MYSSSVLIRVFCYTTEIAGTTFWRDLATLYLGQIVKAGLDVCAVGFTMADLRDEGSPVEKHPGLFLSRGRDPYVSFVIGFGANYHVRMFDAVKNTVLTACRPRPPKTEEVESLAKYDHILVPSNDEVDALYRVGLAGFNRHPKVLLPTVDVLKKFFTKDIF
jgi:hypothetical protein